MSFKQEKVIVIISEFVNDKREFYPITNVPVEKARFFYKDDDGLFKVMASSDYAVRTELNETRLYITNVEIKEKSTKFQVGYEINFTSSEYETSLPVLSVLVEMYNNLIEDSRTIFNYVKKQCFISDDKTTSLVLPNLPSYCVWCMGENGEMFALPVSELYSKFQQMVNALEKVLDEYIEQKKEEIRGPAGAIDNVTASVNSNVGTPKVTVLLGGTPERRKIDLKFENLKGDKPIKGTDYYTQQEKEQFTTEMVGIVKTEGNKVVEQVKSIVAGNPATSNALALSGKTRVEFEEDLNNYIDDISVTYKPENVCDEDKITINKLMNLDGTTEDNISYRYTDYIPVKKGDVVRFYKVDAGNFVSIQAKYVTAFGYDKKAIKASGIADTDEYTVPDGIAYVVVTLFYNKYIQKYEVTVNKIATEYTKYHKTYYKTKKEFISDIIDSSLSQKGMAADAEAVGKALNLDDIVKKVIVKSSNKIKTVESGYYFNGILNPHSEYWHTNKIEVSEGEVLSLQYGAENVRTFGTIRWVDEYTSAGIAKGKVLNKTSYVVPVGVTHIIISAAKNYLQSASFSALVNGTSIISYEPYFEPYINRKLIYSKLEKPLHIYLPKTIYVGVGRTVELYNNLVCLEADKYHLHWSGNIGVAYERKVSIAGKRAGSYLLNLEILDDELNVLYKGSSSVIVSNNSIAGEIKILPIGDSLTNLKAWLGEVEKLSNGKIKYIGTRGRNDQTFRHEGRSGWDAAIYNTDFDYDFDNNYQGVDSVKSSDNPFWNGTKFSLKHYIDTQGAKVGIPNAVQIFLGTNGLALDNTNNANNIKMLVDLIRSEYSEMPIFVCNTIYRSNQNGYHSTGSDGYATSMNGFRFEEDCKIMDLQNRLFRIFENYSNVYILPLSVCMDRDNNYGQVEVPVNPRLTTVTTKIASESVHPQLPGYLQIADVMYSGYCAVLK